MGENPYQSPGTPGHLIKRARWVFPVILAILLLGQFWIWVSLAALDYLGRNSIFLLILNPFGALFALAILCYLMALMPWYMVRRTRFMLATLGAVAISLLDIAWIAIPMDMPFNSALRQVLPSLACSSLTVIALMWWQYKAKRADA